MNSLTWLDATVEKIKRARLGLVSYDALQSVTKTGLAEKADLLERLGLTEENDYRIVIKPQISEDAWESAYYVNQIVKQTLRPIFPQHALLCSQNAAMDNRGNTQKLTRMIHAELKKWSYSHPLREKLYPLFNVEDDTRLLQVLGEAFTSKGEKRLVISANIFDFLTCSARDAGFASFSSCLRPGGDYFSGALSMYNSPFSLLTYVTEENRIDYKIGRAWLHIYDDCLYHAITYGTFNHDHKKQTRHYVEQKLNKGGAWKSRSHTLQYNASCGYIDSSDMVFAYYSGNDVPARLQFPDSLCLACGDEHDREEDCTCPRCAGDYDDTDYCTTGCGREMTIEHDGEFYCQRCFDRQFFTCCICDATEEHDNACCTPDGDACCQDCYSERFSCCDLCYSDVSHDDMVQGPNGDCMCYDCFNSDYFTCTNCDEPKENDEKVESPDGDCICQDCYDELFADCQACQKTSFVDDLEDDLCSDCRDYDRNNEDEQLSFYEVISC
jgi:hypothetical protein